MRTTLNLHPVILTVPPCPDPCLLACCRELADANARVGDEVWVPSTRTYQALQAHVAQLQEALATKAKETEAVMKERDEAIKEAQLRAQCQAVSSVTDAHITSRTCTVCSMHVGFALHQGDTEMEPRSAGGNVRLCLACVRALLSCNRLILRVQCMFCAVGGCHACQAGCYGEGAAGPAGRQGRVRQVRLQIVTIVSCVESPPARASSCWQCMHACMVTRACS